MNAEPDPLTFAAHGNAEALSWLTNHFFGLSAVNPDVPNEEAMIKAEVFARLASVHGYPEDKLTLVGILDIRSRHLRSAGDVDRADAMQDEAQRLIRDLLETGDTETIEVVAGVLSIMADQGSESAAVQLNWLMDNLSADEATTVRTNLRSVIDTAESAIGGTIH